MQIWRLEFWTTARLQSGLIFLGIVLRFRHYLENRSFWQDEICLALSIVNRSWQDLWQHILLFPDFAQAPLFFQMIEKSAVAFFGNSEMTLRLFPFLASIAALFLARRFFNRLLDPSGAVIALGLFSIIEPLVYFSAELKPYGVDVLAVLIVYEMFSMLERGTGLFQREASSDLWDLRRLVLFALGGSLVIWLSNSMLFVLAGGGAVIFIKKILRGELKKAGCLAGCYLVWAVSFFFLYKLSLGGMLNPDLIKNWRLTGGFSPAPIWHIEGLSWVWRVFLEMFRSPLGLGWPYLMTVFFAAGCYAFYRRDRWQMFFLLTPLLITLFAASLEKYPFFERLILFLVPSLLVLVAAGVREISSRIPVCRDWSSIFLAAVILFNPLMTAVSGALTQRGNEFNREAMEYMADHYQPGDLVAISPQAQYPFWYYGQRTGLYRKLPTTFLGNENLMAAAVVQLFPDIVNRSGENFLAMRRALTFYDRQGYYRRFMLVRGSDVLFVSETRTGVLKGMGRVWVFLSHHNDPAYPSFVDNIFSKAGKRLDYFERPGVTVGLYNIL